MSVEIKCTPDNFKLVPIDSIKPNPKNNNRHPIEQMEHLKKLLLGNGGFREPLTVSNQSGLLVCGHLRLEIAKEIGMKELPVMFQDFESPAQEYQHMTADNEVARYAQLDYQNVYETIKEIPEIDTELLGIENFVIPEVVEPQCDEDEVPEAPVEPITKLGDIYKLGNHRLMCGDSTSIDAVEKLMDGNKAEFVFTDPPYNQETEGGFNGMVGKALKKQSSEIEHLCDFNPETFLQTIRTVFDKNKMNALIFCNKDLVVDYLKFARDSGYSYNILFWKKPTAIPIGGSYRPDVEYLLNFRKSGIFNGGQQDCEYSKCLEFGREKDKVHPTMKPVEMIENQVKICSNSGGNVMDFFGGSGSTLIACEKTNRKCFMMELDPKYVSVIIERWCKFTGKEAYLLNENGTQTAWSEIKAVVQ